MLKVNAIKQPNIKTNNISFKGGYAASYWMAMPSSDPDARDAFLRANANVLTDKTFLEKLSSVWANVISILSPPTPEVQAEMNRIEQGLDDTLEMRREIDLAPYRY
jgi:hypothetical protein